VKVHLYRGYQGLGDYLIALAALSIVQRQRPDIELWCTFRDPRGIARGAFEASNLRYGDGMPEGKRADVFDLIYRRLPPPCFIESTVMDFTDHTGVPIAHEPGVYPDFGVRRHHGKGGYLVMMGHGLRRERRGKEWGCMNWQRLAHLLAPHYSIRQVGRCGDHVLAAARSIVLGRPFVEVADLLCGARAFIGLESGLMMLAGFLGVPQITIYDGGGNPDRSTFGGQRQLKLRDPIEPPQAAAAIMEYLR
jgi:hypothetical protein